jgi:hypothetical protein
VSAHTPSPWTVGEFDEWGGYDCMFAVVRVGHFKLDGCQYGQEPCEAMRPEAKAQMMADARLLAAAPELLDALKLAEIYIAVQAQSFRESCTRADGTIADANDRHFARDDDARLERIRTAIAKATGAA